MTATKTLIFTDLDGTLLDHDTYEWQAAKPALDTAARKAIPVIPCTSKTIAECNEIQSALGLTGPVIFENGAGIALPKNDFRRPRDQLVEETAQAWLCGFGPDYRKMQDVIAQVRRYRKFQFISFGEMSVDDVCACTGLSPHAATLARQRRHSEPLLWQDTPANYEQFRLDMAERGLTVTRGGRFVHVMGDSDKGTALLWLCAHYEMAGSQRPRAIALGDSENDLPMLREADVAVIVRNPYTGSLQFQPRPEQEVVRTHEFGPLGWNQAVLQLLTTSD